MDTTVALLYKGFDFLDIVLMKMLYTSCILQTRWGFCDYRSQIHEQYAIICRVTFSIVNYEFAHTANGRTKILFFGVCLTSRINPYDQDGILGVFDLDNSRE